MMRLDQRFEARDRLQVLAGHRRELPLSISTGRPMRKKARGMSSGAFANLRTDVRDQVTSQMGEQGRQSFRGRVAVDLDLQLPEGRHGADFAMVVKGYLDALKGLVYADDAVIDHLVVSSSRSPAGALAQVRCRPLGLFTASFDRSFRVASELPSIEDEPGRDAAGRPIPGLRRFEHHDEEVVSYLEGMLEEIRRLDAEEETALAEEEDAEFFPDTRELEFTDPQLRESLGPELEEEIGLWRGIELSDQGFDVRDRPGGRPTWLAEVVARDLAEVDQLSARHPGALLLPAPLEKKRESQKEPDWDALLRARLAAIRRSSSKWQIARFEEEMALDIAVRGGAGPNLDLDNLARRVRAAFLAVLPDLDSVPDYRVYRIDRGDPAVRVRIMPAARLRLFRETWDLAEALVLEERADRGRDLNAVV